MVVISLIFQWHLFVSPEKLEIKHREILKDVAEMYVPKEQYNVQYTELKSQIGDIQMKIDKMYDIITKKS